MSETLNLNTDIDSESKRQKLNENTIDVYEFPEDDAFENAMLEFEDKEDKEENFIFSEWVSASKTRNYMLKDTLLDWLNLYGIKKNIVSFNENNSLSFVNFIMEKGIKFEEHIIKLIKSSFTDDEFVQIVHNMKNYSQRVLEYYEQSKKEILKGTPIIYQPLLLNKTGKLKYSYGMPDLLIRSDYLKFIVTNSPLELDMIHFKAPNLNGDYHYVVIDIKFTTLDLCCDGMRIRNSGSFPAYKSQLYVYNHALGLIQGYEPSEAFIMGRKIKYDIKNTHYSCDNCFSQLGHIQYSDWDKKYIQETIDAIQWIKRVRNEGNEWSLYPLPSVPELYPNMTCHNESQWDSFKNKYANEINEITLLWNCGIKNRILAHNNNIYSYNDSNCNSENLGINGDIQSPILNAIIGINQKVKFKNQYDYINLNLNDEVDNFWAEPQKLLISVDFEYINNIFDNFETLPVSNTASYLFMIGVAFKIKNKPKEYKLFLLSELSNDAECQLIEQFYLFLRKLTDDNYGKSHDIPPLYHWGSFEKYQFTKVCTNLSELYGETVKEQMTEYCNKLAWYDLNRCFIENPITINGCFKFGLKEIATRLYELKLINTKWEECKNINENTAMILAFNAYSEKTKKNVSIDKIPIMKDIIKYNMVDCFIIHDIVECLRIKLNRT
jgi:hypothetical protein